MSNLIKTTLLLSGLTLLVLFLGRLIGGPRGMMAAMIFAVLINFGTWWFSDKLVLSLYRAVPVAEFDAPEIYAILSGLAERAGTGMPRVYMLPSAAANAFATGRDPGHAAVAVTRGLVEMLSVEELEGVLAHEMAHIRHYDTLTAAVTASLAGAVAMVASMVRWAFFLGGTRAAGRNSNALVLIVSALIAPLAATLIQLAVSRTREYAADAEGARLCGNPLYLASALEKIDRASQQWRLHEATPETAHVFIVSPLSGKGIERLFSTHPPLSERIARLERMAD